MLRASIYRRTLPLVLGWLNCQTGRLKIFVANRVEQILEITDPEQWRHIQTSENPADILSRGATPNELQYKGLWWKGPPWLESHSNAWKQSTFTSQK
jgi:hypothetical protein